MTVDTKKNKIAFFKDEQRSRADCDDVMEFEAPAFTAKTTHLITLANNLRNVLPFGSGLISCCRST